MKGKLETICINCPMGCPLTIEEINGEVVVKGYTCLRGKKYGEQELYKVAKKNFANYSEALSQ